MSRSFQGPLANAVMIGATLVLGLQAVVRLSPDDPVEWHQPLAVDPAADLPDCATAAAALTDQNPARVTCRSDTAPEALLAALDAVALAHPRTTRLAGSPAEGRITWVSRSLLWGFPDYITAEALPEGTGSRLQVLSRQRYGQGDMGVNAARLKDWLGRL